MVLQLLLNDAIVCKQTVLNLMIQENRLREELRQQWESKQKQIKEEEVQNIKWSVKSVLDIRYSVNIDVFSNLLTRQKEWILNKKVLTSEISILSNQQIFYLNVLIHLIFKIFFCLSPLKLKYFFM